MNKIRTDIAVIGASLGGVLAAYSACRAGRSAVLTEETDWIGGQLTSQAVPPDEHRWIETTGCTASYRAYRDRVRAHYRSLPGFSEELKSKDYFCPGGSSVSRLAHPPKLALSLLYDMLRPYLDDGKLTLLLNTRLIRVRADENAIRSVMVEGDEAQYEISASYYLDGTDTGELLDKSGAGFVCGAEAKSDTGERHAPSSADPEDMQPVTWVAAVDYDEKTDRVIERPAEYGYFSRMKMPYDRFPVLSMYGPDSATGKAKRFGFFNGEKDEKGSPLFGLFTYRRIAAAHHYTDGSVPRDVTLLNWPQNDYFMDNIFGTEDDAYRRYMARQLTLSLLYYLQTEAPRADGGKGYPGLGLCPEAVGTKDGLAKAPYIRESHRLDARFRVTEEMLTGGAEPAAFSDSVGVGSYHIDLHITTRSHTFFFAEARPFEIPLGAFIPKKLHNLLPCCKNIGTTHLTNGCFRLHPVEWNIGEAAGLFAAYLLGAGLSPEEAWRNPKHLAAFQEMLIGFGVQLHWENQPGVSD